MYSLKNIFFIVIYENMNQKYIKNLKCLLMAQKESKYLKNYTVCNGF